MAAMGEIDTIGYVLPEEGTILWTDNLTIPASSQRKASAEQFINFLLRPEVSAQMVNETWVPSPNEAALSLIDPALLRNSFVYPPDADFQHAEFYAVVSEETQQAHDRIWAKFLAAQEQNAPQTIQ